MLSHFLMDWCIVDFLKNEGLLPSWFSIFFLKIDHFLSIYMNGIKPYTLFSNLPFFYLVV